MIDMTKVIKKLPDMLSGDELLKTMSIIPKYDEQIQEYGNMTERLLKLSDIYNIYIPSQMSAEIYSKLYLGIIRSMQKKGNKLAVQQFNSTYKIMQNINNKTDNQQYEGIIGGSDSFTIIGASGIGKTSAISRALNLIEADHVIEIEQPYTKFLPCLTVQCPFDSSVKGLLIEILRKLDEQIGTNYTKFKKATVDMLIGSVSQVCLNHIGLLVVDEIQNVVNSKNGKNLIGSLTQLINNSGISICMVGTPESEIFFGQAMQLARRSVGLKYTAIPYNEHFCEVCECLFSYQYVKNVTHINNTIIDWLYQHSAGVISTVVSLIHDAQEIAILNGREVLDIKSLDEAYSNRLSMLHDYINPAIKKKYIRNNKTKRQNNILTLQIEDNINIQTDLIQNLTKECKKNGIDIIEVLNQYIAIEVI